MSQALEKNFSTDRDYVRRIMDFANSAGIIDVVQNIFPLAPVTKMDSVKGFKKNLGIHEQSTELGENLGVPNTQHRDSEYIPYQLKSHALDYAYDGGLDEDDIDQDKANFRTLTAGLYLASLRRIMNQVSKAGRVFNVNWGDPASDILEEVLKMLEVKNQAEINTDSSGFLISPNRALMSQKTFGRIRAHPKIREFYKLNPGLPSKEQIASLLGVEEIVVVAGMYNVIENKILFYVFNRDESQPTAGRILYLNKPSVSKNGVIYRKRVDAGRTVEEAIVLKAGWYVQEIVFDKSLIAIANLN